MSMPTLVVIHGRDRRWQDQAALARDWDLALRAALRAAGAPFADSVAIRFVDYGAAWRAFERTDDVAPVQAEFATELLERTGGGAAATDWSMWSGVGRLIETLGQRADIDDAVVLELFMTDLAEYFGDEERRMMANLAVANEAGTAEGDVILLGHGVGSIASYVALATAGTDLARVRGLITFGSPLAMNTVRNRLTEIAPGAPFPEAPRRWLNVFDERDFATLVPRLEPIFQAPDGRRVEDEAVPDPSSSAGRGRAHDAFRYLGSSEFAASVRRLVGDVAPATTTPSAAGPVAAPAHQPPADVAEPTMAEPPSPPTRSWSPPSAPGAAPPWVDGIGAPWLDGESPPWIDPDEDKEK